MIDQKVTPADLAEDKDPKKSLENIKNLICLGSQKIIQTKPGSQEIIQTKQAVVIIGDTGEGKSSLVHYIAKNPLIARKKKYFKGLILTSEKPLNNIQIGQGCLAKTSIPNNCIDPEGVVYWDCPGFNDTRGVEQDITNGFYIKRIFDTSKEFKIIVVISQESIHGRADKFNGVLKKLVNLFVKIPQMMESLCLVLTKASIENSDQFKEYLRQQFIPKQQKYLSKAEKLLLSHFASENGLVAIFSSPDKVGPIDMSGSEKIIQTIQKAKWVIKPLIRITVTPDSQKVMDQFGQLINSDIKELYQTTNKQLEKVCREIIQKGTDYDNVKERLDQVRKQVTKFTNPKQLNQFGTKYKKLVKRFKFDQNLIKKLELSINLLNFIREVKQNTKNNLYQWIGQITVEILIERLLQEPVLLTNQTILTIKSPLIGIKKVGKILQETGKDQIKFVHLFCYDTFFIDDDFIAPGINFLVFAKFWNISECRKICLKGLKAQNYDTPAKVRQGYDENGIGLKGNDGLLGKPGQTGGSFFAKRMSLSNIVYLEALEIDVRGGDGGNGQDAGNGAEGQNGKDAPSQPVLQRNRQYLVSRVYNDGSKTQGYWTRFLKDINTFNTQMIQTYISGGQQGKKGGDSGKKGAPGLGGYSGFVRLQNLNAAIQKGDGNQGLEGNFGIPGKGGNNGKIFKGQYINEIVWACFREEGRTFGKISGNQHTSKQIRRTVFTLIQQGLLAMGSAAMNGSKIAGGAASLGLWPVTQLAFSAISAQVSSHWLSKGYEDNGRAPEGEIVQECNYNDRKQPSEPFQLQDSYVQKLQNCFNSYEKEFVNSINYKTTFFK